MSASSGLFFSAKYPINTEQELFVKTGKTKNATPILVTRDWLNFQPRVTTVLL
jgi:hypothetical protein